MMDANFVLNGAEKLNLQVPQLQPLPRKDDAESFHEGSAKKIRDKKKKKVQVYARLPAAQSSSGPCQRNDSGAKNGSDPYLRYVEDVSSEDYELIQCLSLEDAKVYTKLVPRRASPLRELWKQDDFPGLQNYGSSRKGVCCSCQRSGPVKNGDGKSSENSGCCRRSVARVSSSCQTDDKQFRVDISSSTPDAVLCRKVPMELRGTVMNIISRNHEYQSVIALLSCLLHRFMVNILHRTETLELLSASDVNNIESILSNEVKGLISFSSRSVRGQSRLQAINACFNDLFIRYPGLQALPGFSDLCNNIQ